MEEDGYVYKGRAVAVEVVLHERWAFWIPPSFFNSLLLSYMRLERDADDHWHDLSKAIAYFAKDVSQEVIWFEVGGDFSKINNKQNK